MEEIKILNRNALLHISENQYLCDCDSCDSCDSCDYSAGYGNSETHSEGGGYSASYGNSDTYSDGHSQNTQGD
jgi:hypothetical protein